MTASPTPRRRRTAAVLAAAAIAVAPVTGCSAYAKFAPENLPSPQSLRSGYEIGALVPTAVNLPLESKVTVDGIDVGGVAAIAPADGATRLTLRLDDGAVVSPDATIELKQDTLLGDTYVAITNPPGTGPGARVLTAGQTLDLERAAQPVQIEQLLSSLANFLGSGSLMDLGNTFTTLTDQFPEDPQEIVKIQSVLADTLDTWATHTDDLGSILTDLAGLSERLTTMEDTLEFTLSPAGVNQFRAISDTTYMVVILARLADALGPAMPLVPVLSSLTYTITDVLTPLFIPGYPANTISNGEMLLEVLDDKVIPWLKDSPGVRLRSVMVENNVSDRELSSQMVRVFRMLGMVQ